MIRLRAAGPDDARRLWMWCNDDAVRASAFSAGPVTWEEHVGWFSRVLGSPRSRIWIAEQDHQPIGQARVDAQGPHGTIDYSIAESHRRRGLAAVLLRALSAEACRELRLQSVVGVVKETNVPSCRAFERAGFNLTETLSHQGHPCRRYEWRCEQQR